MHHFTLIKSCCDKFYDLGFFMVVWRKNLLLIFVSLSVVGQLRAVVPLAWMALAWNFTINAIVPCAIVARVYLEHCRNNKRGKAVQDVLKNDVKYWHGKLNGNFDAARKLVVKGQQDTRLRISNILKCNWFFWNYTRGQLERNTYNMSAFFSKIGKSLVVIEDKVNDLEEQMRLMDEEQVGFKHFNAVTSGVNAFSSALVADAKSCGFVVMSEES